jgi:hypothetical protein
MNQLAQHAFVSAKGVRGVKAVQTQPAKRATPVVAERVGVYERRAAGGTKELGRKRFGFRQAPAADGNSRDLLEGFTANAAGGGEQKREKGARDLPESTSRDGRCFLL